MHMARRIDDFANYFREIVFTLSTEISTTVLL